MIIMFYDLLLLDDIACIKESYEQRHQRLESLIHHVIGRATLEAAKRSIFHQAVLPVCFSGHSLELSYGGGKDSC
jgi:ATP-dependent DNA ligase